MQVDAELNSETPHEFSDLPEIHQPLRLSLSKNQASAPRALPYTYGLLPSQQQRPEV